MFPIAERVKKGLQNDSITFGEKTFKRSAGGAEYGALPKSESRIVNDLSWRKTGNYS